jgi:hypothetical protein
METYLLSILMRTVDIEDSSWQPSSTQSPKQIIHKSSCMIRDLTAHDKSILLAVLDADTRDLHSFTLRTHFQSSTTGLPQWLTVDWDPLSSKCDEVIPVEAFVRAGEGRVTTARLDLTRAVWRLLHVNTGLR